MHRVRTFIFSAALLTLLAGFAQAQSSTEAYFLLGQPPRTSTFVFKLTDPVKIQQARTIVATRGSKIVNGTIIKQPIYYNPGWSFHYDPKTISFGDFAIELCDSPMELIEADLDNAWPGWCPWSGQVLQEIAPPPKPETGNLSPTVSVTMPYRTNFTNPATPADMIVDVNADDADGSVAKLEIFTDAFKLGEFLIPATPYRVMWKNLPPGTHSLFAVATDDQGAITTSKTVTITANLPATGNLLESTDFLVRQLYRDFLGREPDEPGLAFWKNNIDSCGTDAQCREVRQIDTAASFFLAIEFQETGYFVHRHYKASFGRRPLLREFLPDTRTVARSLIVNQPGWPEGLEANKRAFAEAWVNRADFRALYDSVSNVRYVATLLTNSGAQFSESERTGWVEALDSNRKTRDEVLREIVESASFYRSEFNAAFVEIEYFGFMRRNPQDLPDGDLVGYNFWLDKLNRANGDYRAAEMVKAFLTSFEYRRRFGAP